MAGSTFRKFKLSGLTLLTHTVLWLAVLGPTIIFFGSKFRILPADKILATILGMTVLSVVPVYLNYLLLVPRFLRQENYRFYALYIFAVLLIFGLLKGYLTLLVYLHVLQKGYVPTLLYLTFVSTVELLIMVFLFTASQLGIHWLAERKLRKAQELEQLKSEVQYLKAQINPHFLFNTLNNLYALTLTKSDKAPLMVLKLAEMMEYMVYHSNEELVPLQKELDYLQHYIALEKLRSQKPENITFEVSGTYETSRIAPLLLLPFIENGFKHGIHALGSEAKLNIKILIEANTLQLQMKNSMNRFGAEANPSEAGGFGMDNVRKRLQYLYAGQHELETKAADGFYLVNLNLPLA
ncbi:sensor histidine kinase [Adhaeribacter soli]|uniref:Signal transduction histidine kinase internal region domain-containing protein n=1 Tax=Adhaeribacter soli TaxID=2607655 RepID=A0A5N1JB37_9BACT|nr:histidine kinase [Adhaeribacter soli]KAA9346079.1 hypothetical protein F0P94_03075 [Adhaeribacter soli]